MEIIGDVKTDDWPFFRKRRGYVPDYKTHMRLLHYLNRNYNLACLGNSVTELLMVNKLSSVPVHLQHYPFTPTPVEGASMLQQA